MMGAYWVAGKKRLRLCSLIERRIGWVDRLTYESPNRRVVAMFAFCGRLD